MSLSMRDVCASASKVKKGIPLHGFTSAVYRKWQKGALAITLYVCRGNVVILDSPCQAISLIMALIWNVELWFVFRPILPPSPPPLPSTQSSFKYRYYNRLRKPEFSFCPPTPFVFEFSLTLGSICMSLLQGPDLGPSADCSFLLMKIQTLSYEKY